MMLHLLKLWSGLSNIEYLIPCTPATILSSNLTLYLNIKKLLKCVWLFIATLCCTLIIWLYVMVHYILCSLTLDIKTWQKFEQKCQIMYYFVYIYWKVSRYMPMYVTISITVHCHNRLCATIELLIAGMLVWLIDYIAHDSKRKWI